jgi:hypothetical protein
LRHSLWREGNLKTCHSSPLSYSSAKLKNHPKSSLSIDFWLLSMDDLREGANLLNGGARCQHFCVASG